jgi:regulation of enolase protein 1 (concanavalin A-like superfamily)
VLLSVTPNAFAGTTPPEGYTVASFLQNFECGVGAQFDATTGEITVRGSGADIWGNADGFSFTHREMEGNFVVTARVLGTPTETDVWAKAGLMVREELTAGSRHAMIVVTPQNGMELQWRAEADAASSNAKILFADELTTPVWLRLTRDGDTITGEYSADGQSWEGATDTILDGLAAKVNVGLAITSHNGGQISEAKFTKLTLEKK